MGSRYKLSVIIPVYNVELYIDECLESILNQNPDNCEIILVDDGSKDNSGIICDKYASKYDFISVIHKENGGLSSARNAGLKKAIGDYLAFLDSDDRIAHGSLNGILEWCAHGSDLCFMQAIKFFEDGCTVPLGDAISKESVYRKSKADVIEYLSTRPKYPGSSCTKLYKTDFLRKNKIEFPKDRRTNEDLGFVLDCIIKAETYDVLDFPYYEYRQGRAGSLTQSNTVKGFNDHGVFVEESIPKLIGNPIDNKHLYERLMSFVAYEYAMMIYMFDRLPVQEKAAAKKWLNQYSWVLNYGRTRKLKAVRLAYKLMGVSLESKILNQIKKKS